jgi:hypothetical protein
VDLTPRHFTPKERHRWRADKTRDERVDRLVVDLVGCAELAKATAVDDGDAIADGHRLLLVVGCVQRGDAIARLE